MSNYFSSHQFTAKVQNKYCELTIYNKNIICVVNETLAIIDYE